MTVEFFPRTASGASVSEQAAAWLLEFESGGLGEAERREFVNWLKRSPVHIEEFLQISALHRQVEQTVSRPPMELDDILAEIRTPVVPFEEPEEKEEVAANEQRRRPRRRLMGLAAGVAVLAVGALVAAVLLGGRTYSAGVGEQRSIMLEDGSVITLNTMSKVRVDFDENNRRATLVRGEALFDVAKDADRPFHVAAGSTDIRVLGTRFNVYRRDDQTTVTVLEGNVQVQPVVSSSSPEPRTSNPEPDSSPGPGPLNPGPAQDAPRVLAPGQQLIVTDEQILQRPQADIERATAWTQQRLIFEQEPLSRVLEEFNRYNRRKLVVEDPYLASRKVTGVFKVHDLDVLISFLRQQHGLRIKEGRREIQILAANNAISGW